MQNKFFGSKLNSALLLILIILMIFALRIMLQDKRTYLPNFSDNDSKISEITLEGKRICLSSPVLQIQPCFPGFRTTDGKEYYLDANGFYFDSSLKDPVVVRGLLVPRNSSEHKKTYKDFEIEGVVKVLDVKNAN